MTKIAISEIDTGTRYGIAFKAECDGQACGRIEAHRMGRKVGGRVAYKVMRVDVDAEHRRKGVATKLYEAAANEACRRRSRLASTERNPGAHSIDFWRKQVAKGRAKAFPIRGADPDRYTRYLLLDCPVTSLARVR